MAIGRKGMCHLPTLVCFIEETRLHQSLCMHGDGFKITLKSFCDGFKNYSFVFFHEKQNIYPPVIRDSFKMPLQLLTRLRFLHIDYYTTLPQHSNILKNVRMLW